MNPLKQLEAHGQSPWLDDIRRGLLAGGGLRRLIDDDGIKGVTSNPSIFAKAIAGTNEYRDAMHELRRKGLTAPQVYERLALEDVRLAADLLAPVYEATGRRDGYVSLEVSPHLAREQEATVAEVRRLWRNVARPNLMIKVPGTLECMPAIEALIADGVNVNVTLLFSRDAYRDASLAFVAGLERRLAAGADVSNVASVASFFVSRIDTDVDARLDRLARDAAPAAVARLDRLRGKAAIANAKLAYQAFRDLASNARWKRLAEAGAMPQRLLWASTSTKNPSYRDVVYVEELIGRDTVNTLPMATLVAFRDHGVTRESLLEDLAGAQSTMRELQAAGIAFDTVTGELLEEGLRLFADAFDSLLAAVEHARSAA